METKIVKKEKNPFLQREEIVMEINSETAPSIDDIKKSLGKDENLIIVRRINGNFGKKISSAEIVVYENEEAKREVEVIPKKVRKKMAEEKKKVEETAKKMAEEEAKKAKEAAEVAAKEAGADEEKKEEAVKKAEKEEKSDGKVERKSE